MCVLVWSSGMGGSLRDLSAASISKHEAETKGLGFGGQSSAVSARATHLTKDELRAHREKMIQYVDAVTDEASGAHTCLVSMPPTPHLPLSLPCRRRRFAAIPRCGHSLIPG